MAVFVVKQDERYEAYFYVTADSEEEALELHQNGESEYSDNEFAETYGDAEVIECDDSDIWESPWARIARERAKNATPPPAPVKLVREWEDIWGAPE